MNWRTSPKTDYVPPKEFVIPVSNSRRWWIVGLLFIASMVNYLDRATISMALPLISKDLGLNPTSKGVLLSAFFWSYALMQVPIGWCADRFSLRWLYAGTFAFWCLAQGLTGFAGSLGVLILFRIMLGIGESIYLPGGTKIVSLLFRSHERGLPCGVFDFGTRIGLVLGGILVPWLLVLYGWRRTFLLVGFAALFWLIPWLLVFPPRVRGNRANSQAPASDPSRRRFPALTFNRDLLGICLGFFCFDYYWYLLVTWLPDYLVTVRHLTVLRAGIYSALPFFVFGVSEPIGGWVADQLIRLGWNETRTRKGIVTLAFLAGLFLIPASHVESATSAIIFVIGASLVGLATGNLIVILQCCAPPEEVGVWTGMENFAGNIGGVLAPLLTGLLITRTGSYAPAFALAALVLLAGLLAYWFIVGELKPASRHPH
ncbi:MAG: MFS transporter [Acidobacteriia bacterium]|nr:MFS transporter [Terriglobia bacterium]